MAQAEYLKPAFISEKAYPSSPDVVTAAAPEKLPVIWRCVAMPVQLGAPFSGQAGIVVEG